MRHCAVALAVLSLAACHGVKALAPNEAAALIGGHPELAAPVLRLPLAGDLIDPQIGIDAGVVEGLWKYAGRDAQGAVRELTEKGRGLFRDLSGTLATPARREVIEVSALRENAGDRKARTAEFTWRYALPELLQRFTGNERPHKGTAELRWDRGWTVTSVRLDAAQAPFAWTGPLIREATRMLTAEGEAAASRLLAIEPVRLGAPDGLTYDIKITDADVSVDVTRSAPTAAPEAARRTVTYIDFLDCTVEAGAPPTLKILGIRGGALVTAAERSRSTLQSLCATIKEARGQWALRYQEVAQRGPLGLAYSR